MSDNRRRIALLLPNLEGGAAERISVNLANGLAARGYRTDMVLAGAYRRLPVEVDQPRSASSIWDGSTC